MENNNKEYKPVVIKMYRATLLNVLSNVGHTGSITEPACPWCGVHVSAGSFGDTLSRKEYRISGMCQSCQDKTFRED